MCIKTMIGIPDINEISKLSKVCKDIYSKDTTFRYKIVLPKTTELKAKFSMILIIYSQTLEMANKRGGWIIHKMKDAKVADYFWTKECKKIKEVTR